MALILGQHIVITLSTVCTRISAAAVIKPFCGAYLSNYCNLQLNSLLYLGQNYATLRTLLHLGSFITFSPSTDVWTQENSKPSKNSSSFHVCVLRHIWFKVSAICALKLTEL